MQLRIAKAVQEGVLTREIVWTLLTLNTFWMIKKNCVNVWQKSKKLSTIKEKNVAGYVWKIIKQSNALNTKWKNKVSE